MEIMLTAVCRSCNNFFERAVEHGTFVISGGVLPLDSPPLVGQYIYVQGSVLNDGIYLVEDNLVTLDGAKDETFDGAIVYLAIPKEFIAIAEDAETFQEKVRVAGGGILESESFGGYSYKMITDASGNVGTWQSAFASRLHPYRRMFTPLFLKGAH